MAIMKNVQKVLPAIVLLLASGCGMTREHRVETSSRPTSPAPSIAASEFLKTPIPRKSDSVEPPDSSSSMIRTVSFQSNETGEEDFEEPALWELTHPEILPPVAATDGLTLESLEQMALENNPSIRQASAAVGKALGIRQQVGLLPNPAIGYFGEEIGNEDAAGLHGAFVSQTFVRGHKLAWNRRVIGHDVEAARWQVEAQRFRVSNDIRIEFYNALAAQERVKLARQFRMVAEQGVQVSKDLMEAKEGALPDVLQSEMQLSEVNLAIQQAEFELQGAWNEIISLAGMPHLNRTRLIGELDMPVDELDFETVYSQMVAASPLLRAASARVRRAHANLHRQNIQPIPNLNAQLGAGYDDATGDEFANIQLSVPVPIHNKNQGNIRAARAEYCEATQNVKRIRLQIQRELARVLRDFQVAKATVQQYKESLVPKADETLELLLAAQQAGEFDFLRVLTARRSFFEVNWKYVMALNELATAKTKIEGLLLTGGLANVVTYDARDDLRGQALSRQ
jgi:cobalt-zinc-cadmium efflux system outer membrane protein